MNQLQKIVLSIYFILVSGIFLYVPWIDLKFYNGTFGEVFLGYSVIWHPPASSYLSRMYYNPSVSFFAILFEFVVITIVGTIFYIIAKRKHSVN